MGRTFKSSMLTAVMLGALSAPAYAGTITFSGSTTGEFNAPGGTLSVGGLDYNAGSFTVFTNSAGDASIGGAVNNLGTFDLNTTVFDYSNPPNTFTLYVTFTAPSGVSPTPSTFNAAVIGLVEVGPAGSVTIDFANNAGNPLLFSSAAADFHFYVQDVNITPGDTGVRLTGAISLPEGASTVAFLGLGLIIVATLRRTIL
jgi:hypothetical protein